MPSTQQQSPAIRRLRSMYATLILSMRFTCKSVRDISNRFHPLNRTTWIRSLSEPGLIRTVANTAPMTYIRHLTTSIWNHTVLIPNVARTISLVILRRDFNGLLQRSYYTLSHNITRLFDSKKVFKVEIVKMIILSKKGYKAIYMDIQVRMRTYSYMYRYG